MHYTILNRLCCLMRKAVIGKRLHSVCFLRSRHIRHQLHATFAQLICAPRARHLEHATPTRMLVGGNNCTAREQLQSGCCTLHSQFPLVSHSKSARAKHVARLCSGVLFICIVYTIKNGSKRERTHSRSTINSRRSLSLPLSLSLQLV